MNRLGVMRLASSSQRLRSVHREPGGRMRSAGAGEVDGSTNVLIAVSTIAIAGVGYMLYTREWTPPNNERHDKIPIVPQPKDKDHTHHPEGPTYKAPLSDTSPSEARGHNEAVKTHMPSRGTFNRNSS